MKKRKFSIEQIRNYHENCLQSDKATANQKSYSRSWLEGFNDDHAKDNLKPAKQELKNRKDYIDELERDISKQKIELKNTKSISNTVYGGYINGIIAKLKNKRSKRNEK